MKKTIRDIDVKGKRTIVRCDFNIPLNDKGEITDETRISSTLDTISYLRNHGAKIILMSHFGRPEGVPNAKYSLRPVAERLSQMLGQEVLFRSVPEVIDDGIRQAALDLREGDVMLLENVRFRAGETVNDPVFSKELADLADIFVNDAFGTAHRSHSSTTGIAGMLPAVSGLLMESEMNYLITTLKNPKRPFTAVLGGAKVSDKIMLIDSMIDKVDTLIIGGGMAYTFLKALDCEIGKSLLDTERVALAEKMIKKAVLRGVRILLPVDTVVAKEFSNDVPCSIADADKIPSDSMGLDIGPKTIELFRKALLNSGTILWNGPMGVFEMSNFANGTKAVAQAMADSSAITIIGGGDSAAAVNQFGLADQISHISTGGGASLELLEGKVLPGVAALEDKI